MHYNRDFWIESQKKQDETNRLIMCYASFPTDSGGVRFAECQDPERGHHCMGCPAHEAFEKVYRGYREEPEINEKEAWWLAHQFFSIPTAYLCDGEIESWEKVNLPTRYKKTIARQKELIKGIFKKPEPKKDEPEPEQMNIFDFLGG